MNTERDRVLEALIRDEWPKLARFFRTKVPDAELMDLVQQTMLGFVEGRERVQGEERAYLWGIARKQVLKLYGRKRPSLPFDSSLHSAMDVGPTLSTQLDRRTGLLRALHQLPLDHQMAFELRYGEELPLDDVAKALEVSLATAKRYITAAQERLRELLRADELKALDDYRSL